MRIGILTGGTAEPDFIGLYGKKKKIDFWIGVDRGMEALAQMGIVPGCLVGDFDSVRPEIRSAFQAVEGIEWQVFRPEKDETDTELAIRQALIRNPDEIVIFGGTGTRLDHVLGTIQVMKKALDAGVFCELTDPYNRLYLIDRDTVYLKKDLFGPYVSFLPFGGPVRGLTLRGFKYPLWEADIVPGSSLTVSNELTEEEGSLSFKEGVLIAVEARDQKLA